MPLFQKIKHGSVSLRIEADNFEDFQLDSHYPGLKLTSIILGLASPRTQNHLQNSCIFCRVYWLVSKPVPTFPGRPRIVIGFDTSLSCGETIFPAPAHGLTFSRTPSYVLAPKLITSVLVVVLLLAFKILS